MRLLIYILLISVILSCNKTDNDILIKQLYDIQAIGDTLPKMALQRLDSIKPLFDNESEYMKNKFFLLDIRLHDKAYIAHTTIV